MSFLAASCTASSSKSASTTTAPASAKARAMANPIPELAPVTRAALSWKLSIAFMQGA